LVKALARAWRWQRLIDDGVYSSVTEISEAEEINKRYISRILRLALLAPDIVDTILAGRTDQALILERLERPLPASWGSSVDTCSAHARPKNNRRVRVRDSLDAGVGADTVKHGL
jgi:hypothetical protein